MAKFVSDPLPQSRQHYNLLDGLRGVAALMVVIYHIFESWATCVEDQWCNHGYLNVDFFFILSGFVVGYAYDKRFESGKISVWQFFKRRLIRLHPLVILGTIFGVIAFAIVGRHAWDGTQTSWLWVILAMLTTFSLIPSSPGSPLDVRGNGELFSLNGPFWSLFCEYIGNILYGLWLRRLSTKSLTLVVAITGFALGWYAIGNCSGHGHIAGGWTMTDGYLPIGLLSMTFCFSIGLLMSRIFKPIRIPGAFWICSLVIVVLTAMPRVGSIAQPWINGLYETICVLFLFPAVVWISASGTTTDVMSTKICKFWGDISYPLYAVHYPLMYILYAWVWDNNITRAQGWPQAVTVVIGSILLAYASLHLYDLPIRKWLSKRFLAKP